LQSFDPSKYSKDRNSKKQIGYFAEVLFKGKPEYAQCFEVTMSVSDCQAVRKAKSVSCDE
jgi:hypothetical protein